jgi:hypothetical protein
MIRAGLAKSLYVVLALCAGTAAADNVQPADPAKTAIALQILEETHASANAITVLNTIVPSLVDGIKADYPNIPEAVANRFRDLALSHMTADVPKLLQLQAGVWSQHFTVAELQQLSEFYRSPLGQHLVSETPEIVKELLPVNIEWGRAVAARAVKEVIEQLRKEGVKI